MSESPSGNLWIWGLALFLAGLLMAGVGSFKFEWFFGIGQMPFLSWALMILGYLSALTGLIIIVVSIIRSEKP